MPDEYKSPLQIRCWECQKIIRSWDQCVDWDGMELCLACAYITATAQGIIKPCITDTGREV